MSIALSTRVKQASDQVSCQIDDEVAILNLKSTLYFGLNEVGAFIWQTLSEPRTVSEICELVSNSFEVPAGAGVDVIQFITKLHEAGLVETMTLPNP